MTKRASPERDQQVAVVRWLRLVLPKGSFVFHIPNEEVPRTLEPGVRAHIFQKRKAAGVVNGCPDLLCAIPLGRSVWIEMKAPGGLVSEDQQAVHAALRAIGHHVGIATDIETARGVMLGAGVALTESPHEPVRVASVRQARSTRLTNDAVPF